MSAEDELRATITRWRRALFLIAGNPCVYVEAGLPMRNCEERGERPENRCMACTARDALYPKTSEVAPTTAHDRDVPSPVRQDARAHLSPGGGSEEPGTCLANKRIQEAVELLEGNYCAKALDLLENYLAWKACTLHAPAPVTLQSQNDANEQSRTNADEDCMCARCELERINEEEQQLTQTKVGVSNPLAPTSEKSGHLSEKTEKGSRREKY